MTGRGTDELDPKICLGLKCDEAGISRQVNST